MSVIIRNMGEIDDDGRTKYHLNINCELIFTFYHRRTDGLAACLRSAAIAVETQRFEQWVGEHQWMFSETS